MSDVVIVTKLQPPVDSGLISSRRPEIGIGLNVAGIEFISFNITCAATQFILKITITESHSPTVNSKKSYCL